MQKVEFSPGRESSNFFLLVPIVPTPLFAEFHSAAAHHSGAFCSLAVARFFEKRETSLTVIFQKSFRFAEPQPA